MTYCLMALSTQSSQLFLSTDKQSSLKALSSRLSAVALMSALQLVLPLCMSR